MSNIQNDLEARLQSISLEPSSELNEAVAAMADKAERDEEAKPSSSRWRYVWGSVAAAIVMAGAAAVYLLWPQQVNNVLMPSAYAQVQEAMANVGKAEWVHFSIMLGDKMQEMYISFPAKRAFIRNGKDIAYCDGANKKRWEYFGEKNEITISNGEFPFGDAKSLLGMFTEQMKEAEADAKGEVLFSETEEAVGGKKLLVKTIIPKKEPESLGRIGIDPELKRVVYVEVKNEATVKAGLGMVRVMMEYPEKGPQDIYDFGVPRDAKILNNMPDLNVANIRDHVMNAAKKLPNYTAVVCKADIGSSNRITVNQLFITYKKDGAYRVEQLMPEFDATAAGYIDSIDKLKSYRDWAPIRPKTCIWFFAAGTDKGITIQMKKPGQLSRERTFYMHFPMGSPESEIWDSGCVLSQGQKTSHEMLPEEKGENGRLFGLQRLIQGEVRKGSISCPQKVQAWFNADRNWAAERVELLSDPNAPWQVEKEIFRNLSPTDQPHFWSSKRQVQEYCQTADGFMYPSRILYVQESERINQKGEVVRHSSPTAILIYIDTASEISDILMNPDKVTPEMFDQSHAQWQQAFDNDIARICAEQSWPATAQEVAQEYLDAGVKGDWERVALLHPGWIYINQKRPNRKVDEFVLGQGRSTGADQICFSIKPKDPALEKAYQHRTIALRKSFTREKNRYYIEWGPY